jgi:hypothetical protein
MSLTVVQNNHDLVEFNRNKYFFRVADIFLENNKKTEYVDYLLKLNEIYGIIQDFSNSTISNVYRERHDDGSVISTINSNLLITIKNLNQRIINMISIFDTNNYESDRYNSDTEREFLKIYGIINDYDFEYYMEKATYDWLSISRLSEMYMTININYFNDEEDDFNIITKLLTFTGIRPKNTKQLTGKCKILYIEDSSNYPEEVRTTKKVKKNNKKSKNKDQHTNQSNYAKDAVTAGIVGGVAVAGVYYVSKC